MIRISTFLLSLFFSITFSYSQGFELEYVLEGHYSKVTFLAFDSAGTILLSGDKNGQILAWDIQTGKSIKRFLGHREEITHLEFNTTNEYFVSASYDGTCRIWNFDTMEALKVIENTSRVPYANVKGIEPTFALFLDDEHLIYGGYNMEINMINLTSNSIQNLFKTSKAGITTAILLKDNNQLAFGIKNDIIIFDLAQKEVITQLKKTDELKDYICELVKIPNQENLIAAWTYGGKVQIWNIALKENLKEIEAATTEGTSQFSFSKDGEWLLTGNTASEANLWNTSNDEIVQKLENESTVISMTVSLDGNYLATGTENKQIRLWKIASSEHVIDIMVEEAIPPDIAEDYNRTIDIQEVITVNHDELKISIYDDEQEDGDILSLFFNGHVLLEQYTLEKNKKVLSIPLTAKESHLIVHAHNEGAIPPNTVALLIECGSFRKVISLDSKMNTSAVLKINFEQ